jgi:hypothetical protein
MRSQEISEKSDFQPFKPVMPRGDEWGKAMVNGHQNWCRWGQTATIALLQIYRAMLPVTCKFQAPQMLGLPSNRQTTCQIAAAVPR